MKLTLHFPVVVLALLLCTELSLIAETSGFEIKREFGVRVPMRDGVTLSANLYLPDAPGQFPVILVRTPYDSGQSNYSAAGAYWASHGYVYVIEDVRGRGGSDGTFYPLVDDALDGDDSINWCARQAWSTGKIGMLGPSYLGWVQGYAAGMHNPHLGSLGSDRHSARPLPKFSSAVRRHADGDCFVASFYLGQDFAGHQSV